MNVQELLGQARDTMTVSRVFGEPYERDGVTVIPVAKIRGGAGGGTGENQEEHASGGGYGFGLTATPAGVYVIQDGKVQWRPAIDVNRIVLGGQLAFVVLFLVIRSIVRLQAR